LFTYIACNKADNDTEPTETTDDVVPLTPNASQCPSAPSYGDSIIYQQSDNGNYKVTPMNNTGLSGTYLSWPAGLDLHPETGIINVSKSETGVRYYIGFVKTGAHDTCVSELILGGITYVDSIHVLSNNDTLAAPVFNANPNAVPVCDGSNDDDYPDGNSNGNQNCHFDDEVRGQRANDQKLRVRTISGIINLKRSVTEGLFGNNPKNGESKKININYRLNDASKMSKQKVTVEVMYYDKVSNIPDAIIKDISTKRKNTLSYTIINGKPRPPLLIIAGLAN
jgi:hypothetical protein